MTLSAEHKAKISAARRARGRAFRSSVVNGNTLADLHAKGVYRADAARIMGWSESVITNWERDTGLRFARMPQAERNRRQSEQVIATGARERAKALLKPEVIEANAERLRAIWKDPAKSAEIVAKRIASRKANPAAAEQSRRQLRAAEEKRMEVMREFFASDRWAEAKAKIAAKATARFADQEARTAHGRRVSEGRRKARVAKGLSALDAGTLTERQMRRLIADMTEAERAEWIARRAEAAVQVAMQRDAAAYQRRLREQAARDRALGIRDPRDDYQRRPQQMEPTA